MKKSLSIEKKLGGIMILILLSLVVINFFIFAQINTAVSRIDTVFSSNVKTNELSNTLEAVHDSLYEYLNTKSSKALEDYYRYAQDLQNMLSDLNNLVTDNENQILEKNIRNMAESYLTVTDQAILYKRGRNVEKYREAYKNAALLCDYINQRISKLANLRFNQNSANYQSLLHSMNVLELVCMMILGVVAVMGFLFVTLAVRDMMGPLLRLSDTAKVVADGNLGVEPLPIIALDEVGNVTIAFNQMVDSIRINMDQQREHLEKEALAKEKELLMASSLKEARLKYLQAQINPHFLFNSLNAGTQLALLEDAEQTAVFLEKMADFFRYNLHKMQEDATLEEEIQAVDTYIYILNVRFAGDITYKNDVQGDISQIRVPSMLLQPLVENAVTHGIHDCMEEGRILMSVKRDTDGLRIIVEDNGIGMTGEQLEKVRAKLMMDPQQLIQSEIDQEENSESRNGSGIALPNVAHRLELYFGRSGLLEIDSPGPGKGTIVKVRIPGSIKGEANVSDFVS